MLKTSAFLLAGVLSSSLIFGQVAGIAQPGIAVPAPQARDATRHQTGTAVIRGRVLAADTGQPLRRAHIRATMPSLREARVTTTDHEGRYELNELPAGRYNLDASKGAYLALSYGQLRALEPGKPLQVAEGQIIENVDFSLPRGGVITGRILDEFGDPIPNARVIPTRQQYLAGRRRLVPAGGRPGITNDIGEYRLFGLPPGQYYVFATLQSGAAFNTLSDDQSSYAPTYFPGTPNPADAERIMVGLGQIVPDISMTIVPLQTVRVSGTAVDSQFRPLSGGIVTAISRAIGAVSVAPGAQVRPDGSFTLSGLAPGEYTLRLTGTFQSPNATQSATAVITVADSDITGVLLVGATPVKASGRITVDGELPRSLEPAMLSITAVPVDPEHATFMSAVRGKVKHDFTVELRPLPGPSRITLVSAMPNWTLRAVRLNGVDVTDTGIDFKPNEDVSGIEIQMTNRMTEVSGIVTDSRGRPVKDSSVVVFARDSKRWTSSRYLGAGRPDQHGWFVVRSLAPGDYYAIALDYVDAGEATDPEFLDRLRARAIAFSLSHGETKVIALRLVRQDEQ